MSETPRWAPTVLRYETAGFALGDDLADLARVHRAGARSGVILYCSRILEALTAEALRHFGLRPRPNLASNLETLRHLNLVPPGTLRWAHAVRRVGNEARHVRRRLAEADAALAVAFVERWLDWFFREYAHGPRLAALRDPDDAPRMLGGGELAQGIARLDEDPDLAARLAARIVSDEDDPLQHTPVFAAILAEALLDRDGGTPAVDTLLETAGRRFPEDLRLRQLRALQWSRGGELEPAREALEELARAIPDDEETLGLLGGVYKRLFEASGDGERWLTAARRQYRRGWERSRRSNPYLGLNAAATALWQGRVEEAHRMADEVLALIAERQRVVLERDPGAQLDYWDRVTLAEAALILGEFERAERAYGEAFADHADRREALAVTRAQGARIAACKAVGAVPATLRAVLENA